MVTVLRSTVFTMALLSPICAGLAGDAVSVRANGVFVQPAEMKKPAIAGFYR